MSALLAGPLVEDRLEIGVRNGWEVGTWWLWRCARWMTGTSGGQTEVTYWIDRALWERGIATRALALLLELAPARPLYARAVSDNAGPLRVLQKCGFQPAGTETSFAAGRNEDIEEAILRLDA